MRHLREANEIKMEIFPIYVETKGQNLAIPNYYKCVPKLRILKVLWN